MRIRLISDLHCDINENILQKQRFGFTKQIGEEDILLIAGDISNSITQTFTHLTELQGEIKEDNLNTNILVIKGNHELYSSLVEKQTINSADLFLSQMFSGSDVRFMENSSFIKDDCIFIGATLYSDFGLYYHPFTHGEIAERYLNDFRFVLDGDYSDNTQHKIKYMDYVRRFSHSVDYIRNVSENNPDKKIIVFTHFAPSSKSISPKYRNNDLNPSYASDLNNFILQHPNIKLWCHGHMHESFNYKIGDCKVICNPYGYYNYDHLIEPKNYYGEMIEL